MRHRTKPLPVAPSVLVEWLHDRFLRRFVVIPAYKTKRDQSTYYASRVTGRSFHRSRQIYSVIALWRPALRVNRRCVACHDVAPELRIKRTGNHNDYRHQRREEWLQPNTQKTQGGWR